MKNAIWLAVFAFLAPMLVIVLARAMVQFPVGRVLLLVFVLVLPLYLLILTAIHRFSIERVNGRAELKAAFLYTATVDERALANAREYPGLGAVGELQPTLRTNGIGMPGVAIGEFNLRNGQRAVLFVQDTDRPVLVVRSANSADWVMVNRHLVDTR